MDHEEIAKIRGMLRLSSQWLAEAERDLEGAPEAATTPKLWANVANAADFARKAERALHASAWSEK